MKSIKKKEVKIRSLTNYNDKELRLLSSNNEELKL